MADPGLQIRGGGVEAADHPDCKISRGGGLQKFIFLALWASFWSKHKRRVVVGGGGARAPQAPLLDPPLVTKQRKLHCLKFLQGTTKMVIF